MEKRNGKSITWKIRWDYWFWKNRKICFKTSKNFGAKILINDLRNIKNKIPLKKLIINSDIITLHSSYVRKKFSFIKQKLFKIT